MNPNLLQIPNPRATLVGAWPDFGRLLAEVDGVPGLLALDSAGGEPGDWSWIAFHPLEAAGPLPRELGGLAAWMGSVPSRRPADVPGPFAGGFLGALGYDQGVAGEGLKLPRDPWASPNLVGGFYTNFFVFDHRRRELHLVLDEARESERAQWLDLARSCASGARARTRFETVGELCRRIPGEVHRARIERVRELIARGEIYQANLAHPFEVRTLGSPLELYLRLRETNPAPYGAYLSWEGSGNVRAGALISASPELLLEVEAGALHSRPIKGTARRSSDPTRDEALARALLESPKDRAELAMIVDLLRNDLGRVAEVGSVRVDDFPCLRSYPGVHHLMGDVHARLAEGLDAFDALLSVFPGGSITGAPKLRSMEVIGELETEGRGFFTGSAGFVDVRGNACFNILIRTMQWRAEPENGPLAGRARYHVGGGITWSSDAEEEDRETLIKGAKLAQTLGFDGGSES